MPARLVVLVSGTGSNLQALLDACADSGFGARVVAVGADRVGTGAVERARRAGIDTFEMPVKEFATREEWDDLLVHMINEGAELSDDDFNVLLGYLTRNFRPEN